MLQSPIDRFVEVTKVAGVRMVGFKHLRVGRREDRMRSNNILNPFVDVRHVTVHASISRATCGVMRVRLTHQRLVELLVAAKARDVVLFGGLRPNFPSRLVRIMAVDAVQLAVTGAFGCIGVFSRIPS